MLIKAPVGGRPVHVTDLAAGPAACRRLRRGRQGGFTHRRQTGSGPLASEAGEPDSSYAWWRLAASLAASTIGGIGLWSAVILLPAIQAEFGVGRDGASAAYTATLIGFAIGGLLLGRLADRRGIGVPLLIGAATLGGGYIAAANVRSYWQFVLVQAVLIGMLGSAATFGPLVADVSRWFVRRRGIAVSIVASGNYLAGALWPPLLQHASAAVGWRQAQVEIGVVCLVTLLPLALLLGRRAPADSGHGSVDDGPAADGLPVSPAALQGLLALARIACCVAMSMPQVHLVAYCSDLGYGPARGAQMLSLMLACGIVSRITFGFICDRIGGLRTLLLGSGLQGFALLLFLPFNGLVSLYVISALFGLFQGGIVPSYAIIVREHFPASEAGGRVGAVIMCTMLGMALGGWMSGKVFDLTGSYQAAFLNGILWNLLNFSICMFLLRRTSRNRNSGSSGD